MMLSRNRYGLLGFFLGLVIMVVLLFPPISFVLPPIGFIVGAIFDRRRNAPK